LETKYLDTLIESVDKIDTCEMLQEVYNDIFKFITEQLSMLHCEKIRRTVSPCFGEKIIPLSLQDGSTTGTFLITGSSEYVLSKYLGM